MKTIIIGSEGFIGKRLTRFLEGQGVDVQGFSSSVPGSIDPGTGILSDDFTIPHGTGAVVYLAQSPYCHRVPEMSSHIINVNVVSAVRMVELARRANVKRFIYTSTGSVYQSSFESLSETAPLRRDDWYVLSKVHAEEALSLYRNAMDITVTRLFGIYGPGQTGKMIPKLLNSLLQGGDIYIEKNPLDASDMNGLKVSLCYIGDVVRILAELLLRNGPDYLNIAGKEAVSVRQIAASMARHLGKEPKFKLLDRCRHFDLIADITLLEKILSPAFTPFETGLGNTAEAALK